MSFSSVRPTQAYTVTLQEMGLNVVATGSGAINLTGLFGPGLTANSPEIIASQALFITGPSGVVPNDLYAGFTGPTSFGSGSQIFGNFGSGDSVGIAGFYNSLVVPQGYLSGSPLSSTATWSNATFASLGVMPGTYVWSWGDGPNQNFTLIIGGSVPDSGSTVCLLGCALLGLVSLRRKLGC